MITVLKIVFNTDYGIAEEGSRRQGLNLNIEIPSWRSVRRFGDVGADGRLAR
jgi:hypothetical protein